MGDVKTYSVPGMYCGHCQLAVETEVSSVLGISAADVDLATKLVAVRGDQVDDATVRAAIGEAGYEVEDIAV